MGRVLRQAALEGRHETAAARLGERGSGRAHHEIRRPHLAGIDRREHDAVGDDGAERLHKIERQRRPAIARRVIKAAIGIESHG